MILYDNIRQLLTLSGVAQKKGRGPTLNDLGVIENGAVLVDEEYQEIVWVGKSSELPKEAKNAEQVNCQGEVWLPGLIESHTHLIHGGSRHHEYGLRCEGKTYQEIADAGGGITYTLKHTRTKSAPELAMLAKDRLQHFEKQQVSALEIKSGYGLTLQSEIRILEAVKIMRQETDIQLVSTFMPAHTFPPEFANDKDKYVATICEEWIPEIAKEKLAQFFDVFVEKAYFNLEQTTKLCVAAKDHGFQIKLHADQFTDIGGVSLGIELDAKSIDHLDHVSDANIKKLAKSDTVAVLLPGASLFTGTPLPPARKMIDQGVRVAISTDYNPGTCPSKNLFLMTTLACSQMKMTIPEAITAITYNAAAAIGLEYEMGSIEEKRRFAVSRFKMDSYEMIPYLFGDF